MSGRRLWQVGMLGLLFAPCVLGEEPPLAVRLQLLRQLADGYLTAPRLHLDYRCQKGSGSFPDGLPMFVLREELWFDGAKLFVGTREDPANAAVMQRLPKHRRGCRGPIGWSLIRTPERSELWTPWNGQLSIRWIAPGVPTPVEPLHDEYAPSIMLDPVEFLALKKDEIFADETVMNLTVWRSATARERLLATFASDPAWTWERRTQDWLLSRKAGRWASDRTGHGMELPSGQYFYEYRVTITAPAGQRPRVASIVRRSLSEKTWGVDTKYTYADAADGSLVLREAVSTATPDGEIIARYAAETVECPARVPESVFQHDPQAAKVVRDETARMIIER